MGVGELRQREFEEVLDYGCCDARSSDSTMPMSSIKRVLVPQAVSLTLPTSSRLQRHSLVEIQR